MFITATKAAEAGQLLGLDSSSCTTDEITAAYRSKASEAHPDTGGSAEAFARLSWAKEALLRWVKARQKPVDAPKGYVPGTCRACAGTGRIKRPTGLAMFCSLCDGTGNKKVHDRDA